MAATFEKFPAAQLGALGNLSQLTNSPAAIQAFQQQLFRGLQGLATGNIPQHMMQFTPLLFSYQYLMAQAAQQAAAGKILVK